MRNALILLCLLLANVEADFDQRYPFGYPLSSVDGTITCHCDDDRLGSSKTNPKTFRLPRDTDSAWKVLNGAMDYKICDKQYTSEICNYIRSCGSCYADIKRCYLNGIGIPNCIEKNDVKVMNNANATERNKTVKIFIPRPENQDDIKKRSVAEEEENTFHFAGSRDFNRGKNCSVPFIVVNGKLHCPNSEEKRQCVIRCNPGFELSKGASNYVTCDETTGNVWYPGSFQVCNKTTRLVQKKPDALERFETIKMLPLN